MKNFLSADWNRIGEWTDNKGYAVLPDMLKSRDCRKVRNLYAQDNLFNSTIDMKRYRFGKGEYRYFDYPLPPVVQQVREKFYPPLARITNTWTEKLRLPNRYPETHADFLSTCRSAKQVRPTPLILRYEAGGFNTLHQDLYGEVWFPFQVLIELSQFGKDYKGGEFVLVEQMPRAQSRAEIVQVNEGDAIIFTTNFRPVPGSKGYYRGTYETHGMNEIRSGERYALGVIFHNGL